MGRSQNKDCMALNPGRSHLSADSLARIQDRSNKVWGFGLRVRGLGFRVYRY